MIDANQSCNNQTAGWTLTRLGGLGLLSSEEPISADSAWTTWSILARNYQDFPTVAENVFGLREFEDQMNVGDSFVQLDGAMRGGLTCVLEPAESLPQEVRTWSYFLGTSVGKMAAIVVSAILGRNRSCEMDVNSNSMRDPLSGDILSTGDGCVAQFSGSGLVALPPLKNESDCRNCHLRLTRMYN